jgi:hypothetical protein
VHRAADSAAQIDGRLFVARQTRSECRR